MARRFVAGAVYRKAIAGPIPAPFFFIPANKGKIVQEQTAKSKPATTEIGYAIYFGEFLPRYLRIFSFGNIVAIAPAIKKAGTKQVKTCAPK